MTHILLIILTVSSANHQTKDFEFEILYSSRGECIEAAKEIDFSSIITGNIINTKSECIALNFIEI
tara:strand:+ start:505 stop:702 length:198 start_codon:yes stop_codon:yes gene_type:complete